jgi:hypothetical protein
VESGVAGQHEHDERVLGDGTVEKDVGKPYLSGRIGWLGLGTDVENLDTDIYADLIDIFGPLPASSAWGRSAIGR